MMLVFVVLSAGMVEISEKKVVWRRSAGIYRDLGNCYARQGRTDEAEKAREQALKLSRMKP